MEGDFFLFPFGKKAACLRQKKILFVQQCCRAIRDVYLISFGEVLDAGRQIYRISEYIAIFYQGLTCMNTNADPQLKGRILIPPLLQDLLDTYGSPQSSFRGLERRHDGVPNVLDNPAPVPLYYRRDETIVQVYH